jgi:hypothetical protein
MFFRKAAEMPTAEAAPPGRAMPLGAADRHCVNGRPGGYGGVGVSRPTVVGVKP